MRRRRGDVYWLRVPLDSVLEVPVLEDSPDRETAPTTVIGPLGSTVHVLRADAATVAALAAVDWNRRFRRVCVDPARGLITLMSPSRLHEELVTIFGDIVDLAARDSERCGAGIGSTRLRGRGDPPDTGMEPDCAFYVVERARTYSAALHEGEVTADKFARSSTSGPRGGIRDRQCGTTARQCVTRTWGFPRCGVCAVVKAHMTVETEFLALNPGESPRPLDASAVLEGLEPAVVREALDKARLGATKSESIEAHHPKRASATSTA